MVISFSVKQVRDYLLEHGWVYTFRKNKRKRVGKDWMNAGRCQPKIANVFITETERIGHLVPQEISRFVGQSGFKYTYEWCDAIRILNKGKLPQGWIYKVELKNSD